MKEKLNTPYPDYDVLDKRDTPSWNDQTRRVVDRRVQEVPERRSLAEEEWETLEAVTDRLIPQPDRPEEPVAIVPWIDRKLDQNKGRGYRYEDMPPMREAWRLGLSGIEEESVQRFGVRFTELFPEQQDEVLRGIQQGEVEGALWEMLPARRFFKDMLETVAGIYYSHPAAWSEIGYGGPASPRGYVRLGMNERDAWEAEERHA